MGVRDRADHARKRKYIAHGFSQRDHIDHECVVKSCTELLVERLDEYMQEPLATITELDKDRMVKIGIRFNLFGFIILAELGFSTSIGFLEQGNDSVYCETPEGER